MSRRTRRQQQVAAAAAAMVPSFLAWLAMSALSALLTLSALSALAESAAASTAPEKYSDIPRPLPSYLKICHRSDPHLGDCVRQSIEQLRPYLAHGIPELGIPPCEPLFIPKVVVNQGKGPVTITSTYKNIHVYGPSKFQLKSFKIDFERNRLRVKLSIPRLETSSQYLLEGRILLLPIQGHGDSTGNYTHIEATATMTGQRVIKDGLEYMNIKEFLVEFQIGHASVHLSNLFDGDEQLGDAMNRFLNENWRSVAKEIQPVLEDTLAELFKTFANKIFRRFPLDVLLPQ